MTAQERQAMKLAYDEIHRLVNSGGELSQSTIYACVALRQALSPPCAADKFRQLWKRIKERNERSEKW